MDSIWYNYGQYLEMLEDKSPWWHGCSWATEFLNLIQSMGWESESDRLYTVAGRSGCVNSGKENTLFRTRHQLY